VSRSRTCPEKRSIITTKTPSHKESDIFFLGGLGDLVVDFKHPLRYCVLLLLALISASCSFGFNPALIRRNNEVRRAALAYELQVRGPADEVLVDFGYLEWRDNLGFTNGNTVWLNPAARDEYFALRDAHRSYIYLREPQELDGAVSIVVERGGPAGVQSHQLTLRQTGGAWQVAHDEP
jgi:hypothetical protein